MSIKEQAYTFLMSYRSAVLSSHSAECPGYPFGSVIPYVIADDGTLVTLISRLAQHTKNILDNPKISLFVQAVSNDEPQASARLTVLCDAVRIEGESDIQSAAGRFYAYWPSNKDYHLNLDFDFFRLSILKLRFIAGFSKMGWIVPEVQDLRNPLSTEDQQSIIDHMNQDHRDAMIRYAQTAGLVLDDGGPTMVGVNAYGFDVAWGDRTARFFFDEPVAEPMDVRKRMIAMSKATEIKACLLH